VKYGRTTTDLHAKSNMHHQTNIAIQTNVCTIDVIAKTFAVCNKGLAYSVLKTVFRNIEYDGLFSGSRP